MTAARGVLGREAFDSARVAWTSPLGLDPFDGAFLGELVAGARTVQQLADALATSGSTPDEVRAMVTRLVEKRFVDAVEIPEEPPTKQKRARPERPDPRREPTKSS